MNAWGLSLSPAGGALWVSDNGADVATLYAGDLNGSPFTKNALVVSIPDGAPTGQVFANLPGEFIVQSGLLLPAVAGWKFRHGRGCAHCRGTGYKGRVAIGELLILNDELREAIVLRAPARRLKELAQAGGSKLIRTAALDLVQRKVSETDRRQVEVHLLKAGEQVLSRLAEMHRAELKSLEGAFNVPRIDLE